MSTVRKAMSARAREKNQTWTWKRKVDPRSRRVETRPDLEHPEHSEMGKLPRLFRAAWCCVCVFIDLPKKRKGNFLKRKRGTFPAPPCRLILPGSSVNSLTHQVQSLGCSNPAKGFWGEGSQSGRERGLWRVPGHSWVGWISLCKWTGGGAGALRVSGGIQEESLGPCLWRLIYVTVSNV